MATSRKLALHKETLKVLHADQSLDLVGGQKLSAGTGCPDYCIQPVSMWYQTCNASNVLKNCATITL